MQTNRVQVGVTKCQGRSRRRYTEKADVKVTIKAIKRMKGNVPRNGDENVLIKMFEIAFQVVPDL